MIDTASKLLSRTKLNAVVAHGMTRLIQMNFLHYTKHRNFIITLEDGEEFVPGLDQANAVNLIDIVPLREVYDTRWRGQVKTGEDFIKDALNRIPVMPLKDSDVQNLHSIQLKQMNLFTDSIVTIDDWSPVGWIPRQMDYT